LIYPILIGAICGFVGAILREEPQMKFFPTPATRAGRLLSYAALAYIVVGINANAQNPVEKRPIHHFTTSPSIVEFSGTYKALGGSLSFAGIGPGCALSARAQFWQSTPATSTVT